MAQVYNRLTVDVRREVTDIVTAVQKDANSRFLDVYLKDNGLPIDLTGHEVRIYGKKHDGTEIYNNGVITEATNGRCQFELTDQALAVAQELEVQIVIYYNNVQILQSFPFRIKVVKSLISSSAIPSSNEYGALVVLYQNLYEAYDLMTTMVRNIGVPGAIAAEITIDTMWEAWEYLCNYVSKDLTTLIENAVETTVLNISGSGLFYFLHKNGSTAGDVVSITFDDTTVSKTTTTGARDAKIMQSNGDLYILETTVNADGGNLYPFSITQFSNKLIIKINPKVTETIIVFYALYE